MPQKRGDTDLWSDLQGGRKTVLGFVVLLASAVASTMSTTDGTHFGSVEHHAKGNLHIRINSIRARPRQIKQSLHKPSSSFRIARSAADPIVMAVSALLHPQIDPFLQHSVRSLLLAFVRIRDRQSEVRVAILRLKLDDLGQG